MKRYLRKATSADKKLIYNWANDPETRANSFNSKPIAWEDHDRWYDGKMSDENCDFYIFMDFFKPLGVVRVDYNSEGQGEISYSIDSECRGQGLGREMISLLEKTVASGKRDNKNLIAKVKDDNEASKKIFTSLGYEEVDSGVYQKKAGSTAGSIYRKGRDINLEILRVIAMMMVIVLHYLNKGGLLHDPAADFSSSNLLFWLVECFALSCVNVYVLISGYYMVNSKFSFTKLFRTWGQVFFYSVGIAVFSVLAGIVPLESFMNVYELLFLCCPVLMGHYWFATSYILLLCFAPLLAAAARSLGKKQFQVVLVCLLSVFCFAKTIMPYQLIYDDQGNGILWFVCLFMVAAYLRLHGENLFKGGVRDLFLYVLFSLLSWAYLVLAAIFTNQTNRFEHMWQQVTDFNFVFVFLASVHLFMLFRQMNIKDKGIFRLIAKLAPYTFGVYLLHEHIHFAHRWIEWLGVTGIYGWGRPVHLVVTVLIIFAVGVIIDFVRKLCFDGIESLFNVCLKIYYAKKEVWDYLIFGVLTTIVSWVAYIAISRIYMPFFIEGSDAVVALISNALSWVIAVVFAYWTNRTFVFKSESVGFGEVTKEFLSFVGSRVFSFVVEQVLLLMFVGLLGINDIVSKLIISVVVIVLNYIFSKLFVFKKKA